MRSLVRFGLLPLVGLAGLAPTVHAQQVVVRVPFVDVRVGPGVTVRAPFVSLNLPPRRIMLAPPPYAVPVQGLPAAPAVPVLPAPRPGPVDPNVPPVPDEELRTVPSPATTISRTPAPKVVSRPPTPSEFVAGFRPTAGNYDVVVQHPFTGQPVSIRFTLPPGSPRQVRVNRLRMEFDYGRYHVTVRFFRDGTVSVRS